MPIITGVRCHVETPVGAIGGELHIGVGVGDLVFESGGRAVVVTMTDPDGGRRVAIMHLDKAEHFAGLLQAAVKRGRRALRKVQP